MTLNIENINKLIDTFIRLDKAPLPEYGDRGFNMRYYRFVPLANDHNCGTAACIFGWADLVFGLQKDRYNDLDFGSVEYTLGISVPCAEKLHSPSPGTSCNTNYTQYPEKFTLRAAIRVLELLRDTGHMGGEGENHWNEAIANPWTPPEETTDPAMDWMDALISTASGKLNLPEGPLRQSNLDRAREHLGGTK